MRRFLICSIVLLCACDKMQNTQQNTKQNDTSISAPSQIEESKSQDEDSKQNETDLNDSNENSNQNNKSENNLDDVSSQTFNTESNDLENSNESENNQNDNKNNQEILDNSDDIKEDVNQNDTNDEKVYGDAREIYQDTGNIENNTDMDIYFPNCAAAKAAGYTNMKKGSVGYSEHLDNGNGVACPE